MKCFAGRTLDWHDVIGAIVRQGKSLDYDLVFRELELLAEAKENASIVPRLKQIIAEVEGA
jgi:hypothetical protein